MRYYQYCAVQDVLDFIRTGGERRCYAAPTGSGKSLIELAVLAALLQALLVTPRLEIIAGMLDKQGVAAASLSEQKLVDAGLTSRSTTPLRLRSRMRDGKMAFQPELRPIDDLHHASALSSQELLLASGPVLGWTATPSRGTPRSTAELRDIWGEPVWIITLGEAAQRGVVSLPSFHIGPLVDDEEISVSPTGDFQVSSSSAAVQSRRDPVVAQARPSPQPLGKESRCPLSSICF
jgi:superfamily II DNA or RNA helicase